MKKIVLVMAVLMLAAPAWAYVDIIATDEGGGIVAISYTADANVSAFGLNITVDNGATIEAISDYFVGESNGVAQGFGIFPGGIVIVDGNVIDYNTPVADANDSGALGGLGTSGITIEMGALYEDGNQPALSGILCRVTVTEDCNLTVTGNSTRGNVVLEDSNSAPTNLPVTIAVDVPCFPPSHPDYGEWVAVGEPGSWCYLRQCHADADGAAEPYGKGTVWVGADDLDILMDGWKKPDSDPNFSYWIAADFTHSDEPYGKGTVRVAGYDLDVLMIYWKTNPDPNCLDVP